MKRVVKVRDAEVSRQRVWEAAAEVFASHGFDGAKVDDIAARAGVNKAMLYYHFADKLALYREILRDMFAAVAQATTTVRETGGPAEDQLRGYVTALVRAADERPHFPAIWLREVAEQGVVSCMTHDACPQYTRCNLRGPVQKIQSSISQGLDTMTLDQLAADRPLRCRCSVSADRRGQRWL